MKLSSRVTQYRTACGNDNGTKVERTYDQRTELQRQERPYILCYSVYDCPRLTLWHFVSVGLYRDASNTMKCRLRLRKKKEREKRRKREKTGTRQLSHMLDSIFLQRSG